jgi:hypothetical protein
MKLVLSIASLLTFQNFAQPAEFGKIIGGIPAKLGQFPYQVNFQQNLKKLGD